MPYVLRTLRRDRRQDGDVDAAGTGHGERVWTRKHCRISVALLSQPCSQGGLPSSFQSDDCRSPTTRRTGLGRALLSSETRRREIRAVLIAAAGAAARGAARELYEGRRADRGVSPTRGSVFLRWCERFPQRFGISTQLPFILDDEVGWELQQPMQIDLQFLEVHEPSSPSPM